MVRLIRFNRERRAQKPGERTIYMPEVQPESWTLGAIMEYADVYEPVGVDVEVAGIILTDYTLQLLGQERTRGIIPAHLRVNLSNIIKTKEQSFALTFAERDILVLCDLGNVKAGSGINAFCNRFEKALTSDSDVD